MSQEKLPPILALCDPEWVNAERKRARAYFAECPTKFILTLMGYISTYAFFVPKNADALYKNGKGQYEIDPEKLKEVVNGSVVGTLECTVSNLWQQQYIKKYWKGAGHSPNTVRKARATLSEYGLFEFAKVAPGTVWQPPVMEEIKWLETLIVYEVLEQIYMERWATNPDYDPADPDSEYWRDKTLEDLPDHKGAVIMTLFNAVFKGLAQFNRDEFNLGAGPDQEILEAPNFEPLYDACAKIAGLGKTIANLFTPEYWKDRMQFHIRKSRKKKKARQRQERGQRSLIPACLEPAIPY